jgi:hypothetical protein
MVGIVVLLSRLLANRTEIGSKQYETFKSSIAVAVLSLAISADLSPKVHPAMGGILFSFEPVRLGDATGRGAEPSTQRSVSSCCVADAVSLA